MRSRLSPLGTAMICTAALLAVSAGTAADVIFLDEQALAQLQAANPNHYAQVRRILAAANYLCRPRDPDAYLAKKLGAQDPSCTRMTLRTSNPPQWQIGFRLDDTHYAARVVITDDPPRVVHAN